LILDRYLFNDESSAHNPRAADCAMEGAGFSVFTKQEIRWKRSQQLFREAFDVRRL
jgi:hypothetical protein